MTRHIRVRSFELGKKADIIKIPGYPIHDRKSMSAKGSELSFAATQHCTQE